MLNLSIHYFKKLKLSKYDLEELQHTKRNLLNDQYKISRYLDLLTRSGLTSFKEYKHLKGKLSGLDEKLRWVDIYLEKMKNGKQRA